MKTRRLQMAYCLTRITFSLSISAALVGCGDLDGLVAPESRSTAAIDPVVSKELSDDLQGILTKRTQWIDRMEAALSKISDDASARATAPAVSELLKEDLPNEEQFQDIFRRIKVAVDSGKMNREMAPDLAEVSNRYSERHDAFFAHVNQIPLNLRVTLVSSIPVDTRRQLSEGIPEGVILGVPANLVPAEQSAVHSDTLSATPTPDSAPKESIQSPPADDSVPGDTHSNQPTDSVSGKNSLRRRVETALIWKNSGALSDFLRAETLTDDQQLQQKLRWCLGLKRPVINIYWGVGCERVGFRPSPFSVDPGPPQREIPRDLLQYARPPRFGLPTQNFVESEIREVLGPMLDLLLQGLQSRVNDEDFGEWGSGKGETDGALNLIGISLLPASDQSRLVEISRNQGMDVLLVCNVERKSANSAVLTLRLVDVYSDKLLWESTPLKSTDVNLQRSDGGDKVKEFADAFFRFVDKELVFKELPAIKATVVPKRAAKIAESRPEAALNALAEIRYYQLKGLLSAEDATLLYQKLLGNVAAKGFSEGEWDDRCNAISHLLPNE